MPLLASFSFDYVRGVFSRFGIHLLEEFPDGQTRWGTEPLATPYTGISVMANRYGDGFDLFTIRSIAYRLGLDEKRVKELQREIEKYFNQAAHG